MEGNRDLPAHGVMWIDAGTGRILKTELRLGEKPAVSTGHTSSSLGWAPPTTIVTTFGFHEALGIDVPLEMRDRYPVPAPAGRVLSGGIGARPTEREALSNAQDGEIRGVAAYSRFRRFRVTTEEVIRKPPLRR